MKTHKLTLRFYVELANELIGKMNSEYISVEMRLCIQPFEYVTASFTTIFYFDGETMTDVVPVWWEVITDDENGLCGNDFDFKLFKQIIIRKYNAKRNFKDKEGLHCIRDKFLCRR